MRALLLAGASVAALSLPATAQTIDWSGSYVGVHGGYALSMPGVDYEDDVTVPGDFRDDAFLGGVYFGHDWQGGRFVYGISGDLDYVGVDTDTTAVFGGKSDDYAYDMDWLASGRARLGYAFDGGILLYGSAGLALTNVSISVDRGDTGSVDETLFGGVVGVGAEYRFAPNWSFKAEYSHYVFESLDVSADGLTDRFRPEVGTLKFGVAYRF